MSSALHIYSLNYFRYHTVSHEYFSQTHKTQNIASIVAPFQKVTCMKILQLFYKRCLRINVMRCVYSYLFILFISRPWSTMECSQPAAWTTNRSLLVASRARPFQEDRPIPARPYPELRTWMVVRSDVISVSHHTLEMLRHLPTYDQPPGFVPHAYQAPTPSLPHTTHHSHDYHTHTPTMTAFHAQL